MPGTPTLAATTVTVRAAEGFELVSGGRCLVRYGWAAVPFEYKYSAVFAKAEAMPAGPFVLPITT